MKLENYFSTSNPWKLVQTWANYKRKLAESIKYEQRAANQVAPEVAPASGARSPAEQWRFDRRVRRSSSVFRGARVSCRCISFIPGPNHKRPLSLSLSSIPFAVTETQSPFRVGWVTHTHTTRYRRAISFDPGTDFLLFLSNGDWLLGFTTETLDKVFLHRD